jgi:hypothetical protein
MEGSLKCQGSTKSQDLNRENTKHSLMSPPGRSAQLTQPPERGHFSLSILALEQVIAKLKVTCVQRTQETGRK